MTTDPVRRDPTARGDSRDPSSAPQGSQTMVLGVLGGIASGKSAAAGLLAGPGGLVLNADAVAHQVLASEEVTALVLERFGEGILDASGAPDRAALARRVFDPAAGEEDRRALEGWIHPRVCATIWAQLNLARDSAVPRVVLDVPLLLENDHKHGWVDACDHLIFVDTPIADRQRRAADRGWNQAELGRREAAQLPLAQKRARADFVLANDGDLKDLEAQVQLLNTELSRTHRVGSEDGASTED